MRYSARFLRVAVVVALVVTCACAGCDTRTTPTVSTLWSVKTSLGPISAVDAVRDRIVAFSAESGSATSVDASGTLLWERAWEGCSLTEVATSDDGRLSVVSRAADAFSLESPTPHVVTALDAAGTTLWETTMTISGGGAVGLKVSPTASRVLLIPFYNDAPPVEAKGSYQLRDGMSGSLMYEPARGVGSIIRVDAPSDLSVQYVGSVVSPIGEGAGEGHLEVHDSTTRTYVADDSNGDIMAIPTPDGHWYLDIRNHQSVTVRDALAHSEIASTTVEYVGDVRFSADGNRCLLINYRSAFSGAAEETLTGLTLIETATCRVLWQHDVKGKGFFTPAANESLSRLVLASDNPADAPLAFLSLTTETEPISLPAPASAAAFMDDHRVIIGDANGTLSLLRLP